MSFRILNCNQYISQCKNVKKKKKVFSGIFDNPFPVESATGRQPREKFCFKLWNWFWHFCPQNQIGGNQSLENNFRLQFVVHNTTLLLLSFNFSKTFYWFRIVPKLSACKCFFHLQNLINARYHLECQPNKHYYVSFHMISLWSYIFWCFNNKQVSAKLSDLL